MEQLADVIQALKDLQAAVADLQAVVYDDDEKEAGEGDGEA